MEIIKKIISFNGLTILLSIIGILGTIIGIIQNRKNKNEIKKYEYLFDIAGQNMDLEDKKALIKDYQNKIENMKSEIDERIPKEARKIALVEMINNEKERLTSSFLRIKKLKEEIDEMGMDTESEELLKEVYKIIQPQYSQNRTNTVFNMSFYVLSLFSTFLSLILPQSVNKIASGIIVIIQITFMLRLLINYINFNYDKKERKNNLNKILLVFSMLSSVLSLLFGGYFLHYNYEPISNIVLILSAILFIAHLSFEIILYRNIIKNKKKCIAIIIINALIILAVILLLFTSNDILFAILIASILILIIINLFISFHTLFKYYKIKKTHI